VSTITEWLASLGLSEYADRFAENGIDISVLPDLTDQDLKEIGVLLGHRRKMLRAISELAGTSTVMPPPGRVPEPTQDHRDHDAERRQVAVEDCMDGAFGGNLDVAVEPSHQEFADFARPPKR
jgi:hypothetical protein